ncbi:peptidyl-prolyl cis-trans isomerase D [Oxalobacteraceae bacterium GrIS 2.11]
MFEYVRTHQRLMQFILLLFIVPSFALFGLSKFAPSGGDSTMATVAGENISQQEFDDAFRDRMSQMRQRYGAKFDEALFNTAEVRQSILDNLIAQRALKTEVRNEKLTTSDAELQKTILGIPGLTLPDGSFDSQGYARALQGQGLSKAMYENNLRLDLAQQQLTDSIQNTAFAPKTLVAQINAISNQERDIQALDFKAADFVGQVKVTDAMLKAYYDKNSKQFEIPETASIEYLVLSGDTIAAQIPVSDDEIKDYYNQNLKNYTNDEQRRASHILIKVAKGASAADKAAAKAKAEEVLALVKKQPANFAQLARQYSQDEGSAAQGGDLDFIGKGMMVKPFEEAVYKLKQDEISDLVETDFGYHIIRVTTIKPASVKPMDQVKDSISEEIKKQKAGKKFSELAESFTNTVYEQSDSLKPAADKLKLTIQSADKISRTPNNLAALTNPVLSNPKFLKALFSDDVIKNKHNMEAVDLGSNTLVSAHIKEYKPASKRPLEEVKDVVSAAVTATEANALAKKAGEAKLAGLLAKPDDAGFGSSVIVSRLQQPALARNAFEAVMKADIRKLPAFVGVDIPGQGYAVYRINKVQQAAAAPGQEAEIGKQIENVLGSQGLFSFVNQLKQNGDVKIVKPVGADKPKAAS